MGGYHLINSGIKGSAFSRYAPPKYQSGGKNYAAEYRAQSNNSSSNREYGAMKEFKGYMDSKMEWMSKHN